MSGLPGLPMLGAAAAALDAADAGPGGLPQHLMAGPSRPAPDAGPSKKYKPPKKRVKGIPAETYRDRWLKRLPRKNMASWLSTICGACERSTAAGPLVQCAGPCMRSFHLSCVATPHEGSGPPPPPEPAAPGVPWFCPECDSGRMRCFVCGGFGTSASDLELRKCSLGACGRFFHVACAAQLPLCNMGASGSFFRCPQHYCSTCGKSGDGVDMVKCLRCPVAYHTPGCTPGDVVRIPACPKGILCAHCASVPPQPYQRPPPLTEAEQYPHLVRWQQHQQVPAPPPHLLAHHPPPRPVMGAPAEQSGGGGGGRSLKRSRSPSDAGAGPEPPVAPGSAVAPADLLQQLMQLINPGVAAVPAATQPLHPQQQQQQQQHRRAVSAPGLPNFDAPLVAPPPPAAPAPAVGPDPAAQALAEAAMARVLEAAALRAISAVTAAASAHGAPAAAPQANSALAPTGPLGGALSGSISFGLPSLQQQQQQQQPRPSLSDHIDQHAAAVWGEVGAALGAMSDALPTQQRAATPNTAASGDATATAQPGLGSGPVGAPSQSGQRGGFALHLRPPPQQPAAAAAVPGPPRVLSPPVGGGWELGGQLGSLQASSQLGAPGSALDAILQQLFSGQQQVAAAAAVAAASAPPTPPAPSSPVSAAMSAGGAPARRVTAPVAAGAPQPPSPRQQQQQPAPSGHEAAASGASTAMRAPSAVTSDTIVALPAPVLLPVMVAPSATAAPQQQQQQQQPVLPPALSLSGAAAGSTGNALLSLLSAALSGEVAAAAPGGVSPPAAMGSLEAGLVGALLRLAPAAAAAAAAVAAGAVPQPHLQVVGGNEAPSENVSWPQGPGT